MKLAFNTQVLNAIQAVNSASGTIDVPTGWANNIRRAYVSMVRSGDSSVDPAYQQFIYHAHSLLLAAASPVLYVQAQADNNMDISLTEPQLMAFIAVSFPGADMTDYIPAQVTIAHLNIWIEGLEPQPYPNPPIMVEHEFNVPVLFEVRVNSGG